VDAADPIPLSALQHWSYCPRQCALIHVEQVFVENVHTLRGRAIHSLVGEPGFGIRAGCRLERSLPRWSESLGLIGQADVVEFQRDGTPYPIEYKHGRRRQRQHDDLQVAAQAMCLEEMMGRAVREGAVYYASSRRRRTVSVTEDLRAIVRTTTAAIRNAIESGCLPPPVADKRCRECSLLEVCRPHMLAAHDVQHVLQAMIFNPVP